MFFTLANKAHITCPEDHFQSSIDSCFELFTNAMFEFSLYWLVGRFNNFYFWVTFSTNFPLLSGENGKRQFSCYGAI